MANIKPAVDANEQANLATVVSTGATVAALYFGSEVFVPVALAALLSFALAPAVRFLQSCHLGRVAPVILVTVLAFSAIFALGALMARQVRDLAGTLPRYESTILKKAETLRGLAEAGGLKPAAEVIANMSKALEPDASKEQSASDPAGNAGRRPLPVEIHQPDPTPLETLGRIVGPLLHPLATAGLVVIFVMFILLQREDLRNRTIRLFGAGDLHKSTAAIDDAARRLSRYLLSQLAVNTGAGLVFGLALWLLGIPSPILWGFLFGCLRFVPYVGAPLATVLPVALAAAVDSGWTLALETLGVSVIVELIVGQVVEPFLYGHNTGLSPAAVVVAATFWTALWGPIGLILSTPLTVCLVVLGKHVERLGFLDVLLGDRPPLSPAEVFYQRMLANDPVEAAEQAEAMLKTASLTEYYDTVVLPGLLLAQDDVAQDRLDQDRQQRIAEATVEVVDDLWEDHHAAERDRKKEPKPNPDPPVEASEAEPNPASAEAMLAMTPEPGIPSAWRDEHAVLCIGARAPLDDAAATIAAQVLATHGFGATAASFTVLMKANIAALDLSRSKLIMVSCLDGNGSAFLRFLIRRLRRKAPGAEILIGAWWRGVRQGSAELPEDAVGEATASNLSEVVAYCVGKTSEGEQREEPPMIGEAAERRKRPELAAATTLA